jgi:DNA-binding CsgD family transcriptional regulator
LELIGGATTVAKGEVEVDRLERTASRLGEAVFDPAIWPELMEEISNAIRATGAALLQSDIRTPDIPRTASVHEHISKYFADGWHTRDPRANRGVPLLLGGSTVVTDQDLITAEEVRRSQFYNEGVGPLRWFAAVGFWAGSALWGLSLYRTAQDGPFEQDDKEIVGRLSNRLTETATLAKVLGRSALSGMTNVLNLVGQPAIALDHRGVVLQCNGAAEELFDDEIRVKDRRLWIRDKAARLALGNLTDWLRTAGARGPFAQAPLVVRREKKRPVIIGLLPVPDAAQTPFLGARAVLILSDLEQKSVADPRVLVRTFGMTPAEARLASLIGSGASPEEVACALGIARETARNHLKAIFAKTETHRQSELVSLLSRMPK